MMERDVRSTRVRMVAIALVVWCAVAAPSPRRAAAMPPTFIEPIQRAVPGELHGYLDNFTILRSDTFKDDYHVASSRYRASLQFSGTVPTNVVPLTGWVSRFEYFVELRPEYESIYDLSGRFGTRSSRATSGRGRPPGETNAGLLEAFGYDPKDFEEIYTKSNLVIPSALNPNVDFVRRSTEENAWPGLDDTLGEQRFGRRRQVNWDLYYPVREAYFDLYFDFAGLNWLRAGKQQHVWGKADFFRLQDIVNPVDFAQHFFIDPFDDTRIPLWSVLLEHRFGDLGPLRDLAGRVVWVFDRYTPLGVGTGYEPWAIGFGRELNAFAFGNDVFGELLFPGENVNSALARDRQPDWNLKNSGVGMVWNWTMGNVRIQLSDWFAFQDLPAFGWSRLHILEIPGCAEVLPPAGGDGGRSVTTNPVATQGVELPVRVNVRPNEIPMREAPIVDDLPGKLKNSGYINRCGLTGELETRYRKQNTLGLSFDWFEPHTGAVVRSENSWTTNALITDSTSRDWFGEADFVRWVLGVDRPTMIRMLNPYRSFFLSAQVFGTHLIGANGGRFGSTLGANDNFIFTSFAQSQYLRDQLVMLVFGAFGTTGADATLGGNGEYLITNHWSLQLGVTAFLGSRREHDIGPFAGFTTDGRPVTETGFGIGHMQAGGSERNQMNEFWGRVRYRF